MGSSPGPNFVDHCPRGVGVSEVLDHFVPLPENDNGAIFWGILLFAPRRVVDDISYSGNPLTPTLIQGVSPSSPAVEEIVGMEMS
jgi:hypothetical protein